MYEGFQSFKFSDRHIPSNKEWMSFRPNYMYLKMLLYCSFPNFFFRLDKNCVLIEIFNKKPSVMLGRKNKLLLCCIHFKISGNRSCYNGRLLSFQLQKSCCIWDIDLDSSLDIFTYRTFQNTFPHYTKCLYQMCQNSVILRFLAHI